jgi:hypothetical protein
MRRDYLGMLSQFSFYLFCPARVSILRRTCVYIHISDCVEIVFEILLLPNNTASETFLHQSGAVQSVGWIYRWATGLAVTGQIGDIGQNVLQPCFQTGSSSNPSYFHIFFLIAFLKEACIKR